MVFNSQPRNKGTLFYKIKGHYGERNLKVSGTANYMLMNFLHPMGVPNVKFMFRYPMLEVDCFAYIILEAAFTRNFVYNISTTAAEMSI